MWKKQKRRLMVSLRKTGDTDSDPYGSKNGSCRMQGTYWMPGTCWMPHRGHTKTVRFFLLNGVF